MNPWEALATPLEDRPGDTYRKSVRKRVRSERRAAKKPTCDTEPIFAAALVLDQFKARLIPITVVDFYAKVPA
jgi:hypothetical protein